MDTPTRPRPAFDHKAATRRQEIDLTKFCDLPAAEFRDLAAEKPVLELCNHYEQLTMPRFDGYDGKSGYCGVHTPACLTVDLGTAHDIGLIAFLLFDPIVDNNHGGPGAERLYHYRLLAAGDFASRTVDKDKWEWQILCDRTGDPCRNWQFVHIPKGLHGIRYLRVHCVAGRKNSGFHIVRLRAYSAAAGDSVDYDRLLHHLHTEACVPTPDGRMQPIDPCRFSRYVRVDRKHLPVEVGDGFPLSKRIYDTMNFIQLIADREKRFLERIEQLQEGFPAEEREERGSRPRGMVLRIERRYLEGINTTISKKVEAYHSPNENDTVELDWRNIYQILASIADDISIVERDPKNMERVVLDPVNTRLTDGNRKDIQALVYSVFAMIFPYLVRLLITRFLP